ncbi:MAG: cysteine desulfurase [Planctomycetes bacterium]|nr:cysteine desulfurase [Planctomycetota bacterium]
MAEIYLDHNSTTPMDPAVVAELQPFLTAAQANPSCAHAHGQEARAAIDGVRRLISETFGCARDEIVFTSGGTESNNLAIKGAAFANEERGKHIVIGGAEHPCVLDSARWLERFGWEVTLAPVNDKGQVTPEALSDALRDDTALVSVMTAQNVVGTINRVDELAEVLAGRRIVFHTDAAQAVGKIPTSFPFMGADLVTLAGHKFYGPKGVGALIVRRKTPLSPLFHGAGHEAGRRSGTENTLGIVGLGAAVRLARSKMAEAGERMIALRDGLHLMLADGLPGLLLNGDPLDRLPNTLNLSFQGVVGADIAARVPELMLSTGPACHDRMGGLSPTFAAMGLSAERSQSSLRISLGRHNTWEEMEQAASQLIEAVEALRSSQGWSSADAPPSDRPICPRCEQPLRLDEIGIAPSVVCVRSPECRYEAWLAAPAGAT